MKNMRLDILFINPGNRKKTFQNLGKDLAAIEPPFLIASFAAYLRNNNFNVKIIDANAQNLSEDEVAKQVQELNPVLCSVIVYGGQPSASTQTMGLAGNICSAIKKICDIPLAIGGLHPSALPERTLIEEEVDFVIEGEEQIALKDLISYLKGDKSISDVPAIWYYKNEEIVKNPKLKLIDDLDTYLPLAAWDLLPMDKYRAHNWHCFDHINQREPYAAIYTSLGCPYKCTFCCINASFGGPSIRYRSPELVVQEIEHLVKTYNIKNIKFIDEMFVLDEKHYMKIAQLLIEKEFDLNIWCYARVDTVKLDNLVKMKKAGFNWLCLGIESASEFVREGASKKLRYKDIKKLVHDIEDIGIRVIANFMVGLPDDNIQTMEETLNMAIEINADFFNIYSTMAYPGSKLYDEAIKNNVKLPNNWSDYSQHSKNQIPLPTKYLSAKEVLTFRDNAWNKYFTNDKYINKIKNKFGEEVVEHIKLMTNQTLVRND